MNSPVKETEAIVKQNKAKQKTSHLKKKQHQFQMVLQMRLTKLTNIWSSQSYTNIFREKEKDNIPPTHSMQLG